MNRLVHGVVVKSIYDIQQLVYKVQRQSYPIERQMLGGDKLWFKEAKLYVMISS